MLSLLTRHREAILKFKERVPSDFPTLFNDWISTYIEEQVSNFRASKRISKANQTPKKTARPKDEVQGIYKLLGSYPKFKLKDVPQGLESFGETINFLVDNSTSTVPFPYPKLDVAMYFQTSNLKSKAL